MKKFACLIAATAVISTGCQKKESPAQTTATPAEEAAAQGKTPAPVPIATHLGIATRIPADADVFIAGYGTSDTVVNFIKPFMTLPDVEENKEEIAKILEKTEEFSALVGDEAFLFIGPGLGGQLETVGKSYRGFSAAWTEFALGAALDSMAKKEGEPDFSALEESLYADLMERWMDALEKDSRLQVPTVVMGWRPDASKLEECLKSLGEGLDQMFSANEKAAPVSFESSGTTMKGYELSGRDAFGDLVAGIREDLQKEEVAAEVMERLSPERIERMLVALENMRFTVASGVLDGRVLVYLGNGKEGLRFAEKPEDSLAATDALKWTQGYAEKRVLGASYLSEPIVRAVLPWLDSSEYWSGLARAIRPPVKDERLMRDLLSGMADIDRDLAGRAAMAWSAVLVEDQGWRYESRGGWPDPGLDYTAPLLMTDAAVSLQPAARMHWVQNRERKERRWDQVEQLGMLVEAIVTEVQNSDSAGAGVIPEEIVTRLIDEVRNLNRGYHDEFRAGIGDEMAFAMDFKGEMPPVPGISEETVANSTIPRFLIARPVTDRAKIDAAGKTFAASWRSLTAWASEASGTNYPLILPQRLESGGLETWYPPLPFIGGDFLPGVSLNDKLWMMGTSQSMAVGFSKSMATPASGSETGMIAEIDFAPLRAWTEEMKKLGEKELEDLANELTEEQPDAIREQSKKSLEEIGKSFEKLEGLSYRKWLADGAPRTSLHLRKGE
ncbi:hypothetical protein OKA04_19375 [Luteolibacter flavescens]|uniref:Uncharacterized protein n=1 Tax=Luteolibacter flavescens TaxID=1859460 RepID=A0ABT3FTK4_9BACT|nr:hypothetical protein [Luteolibacter flavescens]MCW1886910.1 hypothetical protein [Luteolibacter flavescens]